ncbi:DUF3592 domain-containing protein [Planctomycetota bacterium]|nr:DUF3592 domain-containing protein [Planctomycetota bacterium]
MARLKNGEMTKFLLLFASIFTVTTAVFVVIITYNGYRQIKAKNYPTVEGVVTSSEIERHQDSDGTTYTAIIEYRYEVAGEAFENDVYRFGDWSSGHSHAKAITKRFKKGKKVAVHYDADDPQTAVLIVGLQKLDYTIGMFILPFAMISIGAWIAYVRFLTAKRLKQTGGIKVNHKGDEVVAKFTSFPGIYLGIAVVGVGGMTIALLSLLEVETITLEWIKLMCIVLPAAGIVVTLLKTVWNKVTAKKLTIDLYRSRLQASFGKYREWIDLSQIIRLGKEIKDTHARAASNTIVIFNITPVIWFVNDRGVEECIKLRPVLNESAAEAWNTYLAGILKLEPEESRDEQVDLEAS